MRPRRLRPVRGHVRRPSHPGQVRRGRAPGWECDGLERVAPGRAGRVGAAGGDVMTWPGDLALIDSLDAALVGLATPYRDRLCWCEKAIDNPMIKDHSDACENAWKAHREANP